MVIMVMGMVVVVTRSSLMMIAMMLCRPLVWRLLLMSSRSVG